MSDRPGFDRLSDLFRGRPGAGELGAGQAPAEVSANGGDEQAAVIHGAGEQGGLHPPGAGYVSPSIPPGMPYAPELNTAPSIPKGDRFPDVPKLWDYKRFTIAAGGVTAGLVGSMDQVGFPIVSVRVDNWTALYLLVRGPNVYVPPFTIGAIVKTFNNPQSVEIISEAPPGVTQGAVTVGQVCDVWCFEDDLTPTAGTMVASAGGGATAVTLNPSPAATSDAAAPATMSEVAIGIYNGATIERVRDVAASKDTAGTGILAAGILGFDGTNYRAARVVTGSGSFTPGVAGGILAVALYRADGQDFSGSENGWANGDNYNPALAMATTAMMSVANYGNGSNAGDRLRTPSTWKQVNAVLITAETTIWTPAAGKKFRVLGFMFGAGATGGTVTLRDNTAGTIIFTIPIPANGIVVSPPGMVNGILSAAANNVLTATGAAGETITGFVFGSEE